MVTCVPLLEVENLRTEFRTERGAVAAVDGVSWSIGRGQTLALVGESGCGKTATALSVMRLIPEPPGRIAGGRVLLHGDSTSRAQDLLQLPEASMRRVRGNRIAMIFQEPMTSLNPVMRIGDQIAEAVELHQGLKRRAAMDVAVDMLRRVGIAGPDQRIREYAHQLSGGMRQRVMIAMALSCNPALLIADEPTTALDVTVQAQILELLKELQAANEMSIVLITHDLGVVAQFADEVCVMYAGRIVERATVGELFDNPLHPYTRGLLKCLPRIEDQKRRLDVVPGSVPDLSEVPAGCRFHPRCALTRVRVGDEGRRATRITTEAGEADVLSRCIADSATEPGGDPLIREVFDGHWVACFEAAGYDRVEMPSP